jgi:predicted porin
MAWASTTPWRRRPPFLVIGVSNTAAGAGDTEAARYNTSVQYRVAIGPFRLAALYQFGGYDQGNGSDGAFEAQVGADFGSLSFDAVGGKVKDVISLSNFGESPLPSGVAANDRTEGRVLIGAKRPRSSIAC